MQIALCTADSQKHVALTDRQTDGGLGEQAGRLQTDRQIAMRVETWLIAVACRSVAYWPLRRRQSSACCKTGETDRLILRLTDRQAGRQTDAEIEGTWGLSCCKAALDRGVQRQCIASVHNEQGCASSLASLSLMILTDRDTHK